MSNISSGFVNLGRSFKHLTLANLHVVTKIFFKVTHLFFAQDIAEHTASTASSVELQPLIRIVWSGMEDLIGGP